MFIIGSSGSGKSAFLNLLGALENVMFPDWIENGASAVEKENRAEEPTGNLNSETTEKFINCCGGLTKSWLLLS